MCRQVLPACASLVLYCKHDTLNSMSCSLKFNVLFMTLPITIRLVNHKTGEIYATKVVNDFTTNQFECKEVLYRWCDCFLRAIDKGEDMRQLSG